MFRARASSEHEKMKTFDICDNEGRLKSFQISSWMGRRRASKVIGNIPGANVTRVTSRFSWNFIVPNRDDVVCEFEFGGIKFEVFEAWGDSSRYWIGPMDNEFHPQCLSGKLCLKALDKSWDRSLNKHSGASFRRDLVFLAQKDESNQTHLSGRTLRLKL
jgi:hypothetical protein